ncbi:MAG: transglutaminase domain-containing protein [Gemmatales bacterium]|nr:transglutaminase domain-containing protein [Gemmatales bacterium]MDW8387294.1 transglutaminase domain-containing protein [Gemmatales bacterium]
MLNRLAAVAGLAFFLSGGIVLIASAQQPELPQPRVAESDPKLGKEGTKPELGKIVKEVWEAAFLDGNQAGHVHGLIRELIVGEQTHILAATELELTLLRFNQQLTLKYGYSNVETTEGKVLAFVVQQTLAKDQVLTRKGKVEGKQCVITVEAPNRPATETKMMWNEQALGIYAQERLFQERKPEPNSRFDFIRFEPTLDTWLTVHVEVKDWEEVALLGKEKRKLLRVETRLDRVMNIELPPEIAWIDDEGEVHKRQMDVPGMGTLTMYRTTKEQALRRAGAGSVSDVGLSQLVRINKAISRPNETAEVVFRIRIKGEQEPQSVIPQDDRQVVRAVKTDELELVVKGQITPSNGMADSAEAPPEEYLRSNHTLCSDDARVKQLARQAVNSEKDPWRKALRIENWVCTHLRNKNFTEAFATADQVARSLEGDCTEHAVLAAAMCRAVGVPSRTVIGLVHVPTQRAMGFHMWIEVWINGKWYALDPTLGQGRVGATHLKISDQHWNDTQSLLPFLPLTRILGRLEIEVLSVKYPE